MSVQTLIDEMREAARACGYALAVHGSLSRDLDVVAVPWTDSAEPAVSVSEAVRAAAERVAGDARMPDGEASQEWFRRGCPGMKPHGRLVWSYMLPDGWPQYIDMAVMPRTDPCVDPYHTR